MCLTAGVVINVGLLAYFKYRGFLLGDVLRIPGMSSGDATESLPLGISFFTFQQLTWLFNAARLGAEKPTLPIYALFVTSFPQLIAGTECENYHGPRFGEYACDYMMSRRPNNLQSLELPLAIQLIVAAGPEQIVSGVWSRLVRGTSSTTDTKSLRGDHDSGDRVITPDDIEQQSRFARNRSAAVPRWQPPL